MPRMQGNGIEIEYDTFGDSAGRPLLLVMGLGAQMIAWHEDFCARLADAGHYVIRFDNRDTGLSTHLDEAGMPDMMAILGARASGEPVDVPYTLDDMAEDGFAVLDHLGLHDAHICGASLGGMIAQTMALKHPNRVRSLISIMSTTGNPDLPPATPAAMEALMSPAATDREGTVERALRNAPIIGSPGFPADRAFNPAGVARQMAAATVQVNRRPLLESLRIPALVIHGADDPLVPLSGGLDTHEAIPGAELLVIDGMGHDLPRAVWPQIVERISALTARA